VREQELELLQFPTAYPIKVVCRRRADLRIEIDAIVRRHSPELCADAIQERDSSAGNYVSISYALTARSAGHVTALLAELRGHDAVVMVL
jgi:putative lipoic acid-binding regulatory protein